MTRAALGNPASEHPLLEAVVSLRCAGQLSDQNSRPAGLRSASLVEAVKERWGARRCGNSALALVRGNSACRWTAWPHSPSSLEDARPQYSRRGLVDAQTGRPVSASADALRPGLHGGGCGALQVPPGPGGGDAPPAMARRSAEVIGAQSAYTRVIAEVWRPQGQGPAVAGHLQRRRRSRAWWAMASTTLRPWRLADCGLRDRHRNDVWRSPPGDIHPASVAICAASPPPSSSAARAMANITPEPLLRLRLQHRRHSPGPAGVAVPFTGWLLSPMIAAPPWPSATSRWIERPAPAPGSAPRRRWPKGSWRRCST